MICSIEVILVCLCSITLYHYCASSESSVIFSTKTAIQNVTHLDTHYAFNSSNIIKDENLQSSKAKDRTHQGREHVTVAPSRNPMVFSVKNSKAVTSPNLSNISNDSAELHEIDSSRISETYNVSKPNLDRESNTFNKNDKIVNNTNMVHITSTTQKSTVIKTVPTKPMRTEHDELNFLIESKQVVSHTEKIPNIDTYAQKRNRRADYVVPIVAVILSVPLVAILISVLYKRSTDWWQHRNYRRMDFLIEGMYNN